jgi:hypothetical protein
MEEKIDSVLSLIESDSWRSAVFTSFTLSLIRARQSMLTHVRFGGGRNVCKGPNAEAEGRPKQTFTAGVFSMQRSRR